MDEQQLNMLDALADEKYSSALVIKQLVQEVRLQRTQNGNLQQQNAQLQARLNERRMIPRRLHRRRQACWRTYRQCLPRSHRRTNNQRLKLWQQKRKHKK